MLSMHLKSKNTFFLCQTFHVCQHTGVEKAGTFATRYGGVEHILIIQLLVGGGTNSCEKYARQIGSFPQSRGNIKKSLKPPPIRLYIPKTVDS